MATGGGATKRHCLRKGISKETLTGLKIAGMYFIIIINTLYHVYFIFYFLVKYFIELVQY